MKEDAYTFAREVDRQIEGMDINTYLNRVGRSSRLQEELYPLSRLALHLKQPGLEVEVEAFENSGPVDGHVSIKGFREDEFDVEVTSVYSYEEALRAELLVAEGSVPGAGPIKRDQRTGAIIATGEAVRLEEHTARVAEEVLERFRAKADKSYGPNTVLLIAFSEVKLQGRLEWDCLFEAMESLGGIPSNSFKKVYLFNSATNELRYAA